MTPYLNSSQEALLHELIANAQCDVETVAELISAVSAPEETLQIEELDGL